MKTLLCDLTRNEVELLGLNERYDAVVDADDAAASRPCSGCFGCWMRTPSVCTVRDRLGDLSALLGATDELHIASRCTYGGWSAPVKRILDRSLGYLNPRFTVRNGKLGHRPRFTNHLVSKVWFYGPSTESERSCARTLAQADSENRSSALKGVWFPADPAGIGIEKDDPAIPDHAPYADAPTALPKRIALINASPRGKHATTELILNDFEDAFNVYACHGASRDSIIPTLSRFIWDQADAFDPHDPTDVDTIVLGYPLYCDSLPSHVIELLDEWSDRRALAPTTRLYAIANMGLYEPSQILPSFRMLEHACIHMNLVWCGGVAAGAGGMIPALAGTPRMGIMRRNLSEAIDKLILAVRCGTDAGTIEARAAIPRFAYALAAESQWKAQARRNGTTNLNSRVPYQGQYAPNR